MLPADCCAEYVCGSTEGVQCTTAIRHTVDRFMKKNPKKGKSSSSLFKRHIVATCLKIVLNFADIFTDKFSSVSLR